MEYISRRHLPPPPTCLPLGLPNAPWKRVCSALISAADCSHYFTATVILCAPGQMHELETRLIDGRLQRVYKNLWPTLRVFWLWAAQQNKDAVYAVFENQRHTFAEIFQRSLKAAAMYHDVYGVRKGLYLLRALFILLNPSRRQSRYMFAELSRVLSRLLGMSCVSQPMLLTFQHVLTDAISVDLLGAVSALLNAWDPPCRCMLRTLLIHHS